MTVSRFDEWAYEQQVVRPLRGAPGPLPADLAARYAVDPGMDRAALAERLAEIRAYWVRRSRMGGYVGSVCDAFLAADADLLASHGAALDDPGWWRVEDRPPATGPHPVARPVAPPPPARPPRHASAAGSGPRADDVVRAGAHPAPAVEPAAPADPHPDAVPVEALAVVPVDSIAGSVVRVVWRPVAGGRVSVRRAETACPWPLGAEVSVAALDGYGIALDGPVAAADGRCSLVVEVPAGRHHYTAFTLTARGAIRGGDTVAEVVPTVGLPQARRHGREVALAWAWPDGIGVVEVTWEGGGRRLTRREYRISGGLVVECGPGPQRFDLVSVILGEHGAERRSAAVTVDLPAAPPAVFYTVAHHGGGLRRDARVEITLTSEVDVPGCTVVLVAQPGETMPREPDHGVELVADVVAVGPSHGPATLVAARPRLRRPYWLRCFLRGPAGVRLVDPPAAVLKVR